MNRQGKQEQGTKPKLKVTIKKWHAVSNWSWDTPEENCGICRAAFNACCTQCKNPGDECPPVWGKCKHVFHMHCILKWLSNPKDHLCPMCKRPWDYD